MGGRTTLFVAVTTMILAAMESAASNVTMYCYEDGGHTICYCLHADPKSWSGAFNSCRDDEGILASVYTESIQEDLRQFMENNSLTNATWIGGGVEDPTVLENNPASQWRWVYECNRCNTVQELEDSAMHSQGCYRDYTTPDLSSDITGSVNPVTPAECEAECDARGFTYSGNQDGDRCACDTDFGAYGTSSGCLQPCDDDPSVYCGGIDNNYIFRINGSFGIWGYDQPGDNDSPHEYCASPMLQDVNGGFGLRHQSCALNLRYVCRLPDAHCGAPLLTDGVYFNVSESCLYLSDNSLQDTWHRARRACQDKGGDLVTMTTETDYLDVSFIIRNITTDSFVWFGVVREVMVWKRLYSEVEMDFTNFAENEVDHSRGRCLYMEPNDNFSWKMGDCNEQRQYICYTGPDIDPSPTTLAETTATTQPTAYNATETTGKANTTSLGSTQTVSTTTVVPPTDGPLTEAGGLTQTEKILIGVCTAIGVLLIIALILAIYYRKRNAKKVGVADGPTEKVDARTKACFPESGRIGDVDEGYDNYPDIGGSQVNLIAASKTSSKVPKSTGRAADTPTE